MGFKPLTRMFRGLRGLWGSSGLLIYRAHGVDGCYRVIGCIGFLGSRFYRVRV